MSRTLKKAKEANERFAAENGRELLKHVQGQDPKLVVLTCADSRVVPEKIFDAGIGEIFVVRVAGNVAFEPSVIESLEYAVAHLDVDELIIMGHSNCGAVAATVAAGDAADDSPLLSEIKAGLTDGVEPVRANLDRQLRMLPERSAVIRDAVESGSMNLRGAVYRLDTGRVEFV